MIFSLNNSSAFGTVYAGPPTKVLQTSGLTQYDRMHTVCTMKKKATGEKFEKLTISLHPLILAEAHRGAKAGGYGSPAAYIAQLLREKMLAVTPLTAVPSFAKGKVSTFPPGKHGPRQERSDPEPDQGVTE